MPDATALTDQEAEFVERLAQLLSAGGLPRVGGRVWAYLLICEPPQQSAADLAEHLHASRGSISGAARVLETAGLVRRATRRGDRREYFNVPPGFTRAFVESQVPRLRAFRQLTEEGLELLNDRPASVRERVQEVHDLYEYFEQVYPRMLEQFNEERASAARKATA
jgi:DNA-binding transcriptional regulator GbsR (MarR family)